jgi:quercetin dioxygenase-like cupin family protein
MSLAHHYSWSEVAEDHPIPLLLRRKILTDKVLVARITLLRGCSVAMHSHVSEQVSIHLSGRVKWFVGRPGEPGAYERETGPGDVIVLPSHVVHGVETIEDSELIDILCPAGPMGVDSQKT